jgi:hypothetical protein
VAVSLSFPSFFSADIKRRKVGERRQSWSGEYKIMIGAAAEGLKGFYFHQSSLFIFS